MRIEFTPHFQRAYKRLIQRHVELQEVFSERVHLFVKNRRDPILRDHALVGHLKGSRAISIGYDLRALYFVEKTTCIFFDIGTHDDVYE